MLFHGIDLDSQSRCYHYHSIFDIVALKCGQCQRYYACYHCHDAMENHAFVAVSSEEEFPVLCGACKTYLTFLEYKSGSCPYCQSAFNPQCQLHDRIYFSKEFFDEQH